MEKSTNKSRVTLASEARLAGAGTCLFNIEFYIYPEGKVLVAYCPSLDLAAGGKTFNEAVSSFYETIQLYLDYCIEHNTLYDDLTAHGWSVKDNVFVPPLASAVMQREEMKELIDSGQPYQRIVSTMQMPTYA
ncbi:MAG: hypothetical protein LUC22_03620 [Prevotella sp.]|nr:hypothetical protein [Prevotella sp.]